jgi:hypothetical protein
MREFYHEAIGIGIKRQRPGRTRALCRLISDSCLLIYGRTGRGSSGGSNTGGGRSGHVPVGHGTAAVRSGSYSGAAARIAFTGGSRMGNPGAADVRSSVRVPVIPVLM